MSVIHASEDQSSSPLFSSWPHGSIRIKIRVIKEVLCRLFDLRTNLAWLLQSVMQRTEARGAGGLFGSDARQAKVLSPGCPGCLGSGEKVGRMLQVEADMQHREIQAVDLRLDIM